MGDYVGVNILSVDEKSYVSLIMRDEDYVSIGTGMRDLTVKVSDLMEAISKLTREHRMRHHPVYMPIEGIDEKR
ncbi:MAG: hypothetical protein WC822_04570 [Candidatus Paceibacterota bacterium]|jgi:hypothetical protein